jgi:GTP-binding protein
MDAILELKVLADVGLVGFPNAGKSTLLSVLTSAKPKLLITRLQLKTKPRCSTEIFNLCNCRYSRYYRSAAEEKLGHYFLRHIERNSTLLFLVPVDTPDIKGEYDILVNELTKYNPEMLDKERLLVISKCDMLDDELTAELKEELDVSLKGVRTCLYRLLHNKG